MDAHNLNGDTAPRGLRNALRIVKASVNAARKKIRAGFSRQPRQVCKVCGKLFDHAIIAPDAVAVASLCDDCRQKLVSGMTALVTMNPDAYAFVKSPHLEACGYAGKIVPLSRENFNKISEKYKEQQSGDGAAPAS